MITKIFYLLLLCKIWTASFGALYQKWARQAGTTGYDEAKAITVDQDGNIYVAGQVSASLDNQPYVGGSHDIVVMKYNSLGVRQWTRMAGSTGDDAGFGGKMRCLLLETCI